MKSLILISLMLAVTQCWVWYEMDSRKVDWNTDESGDDESFSWQLYDDVKNAPQPAGYCKVEYPELPLENSSMCEGGKNNDIGSIFQLWWTDAQPATYDFRFGVDFGRGSTVMTWDPTNEWVVKAAHKNDLWWHGDWEHSSVFEVTHDYPEGQNGLYLIGSEACCDGVFNVQFKRNGGEWIDFNYENFNCKVPSPELYVQASSVEIKEKPEGDCAEFGENMLNAFWEKFDNDTHNNGSREGYCDIPDPEWPIENSKNCGGGNTDIGWLIHTEFILHVEAKVAFEYGVDFGKGMALYIDYEWTQSNPTDLWWGDDMNWEHEDVISVERVFGPGYHDVDVYGIEGCCDGHQAVRFRINDGDWMPLTIANWETQSPKPQPPKMVVETRKYQGVASGTGEEFANNLKGQFESAPQPDGYCSVENPNWPLEASHLCNPNGGGPNGQIVWRWEFTWHDNEYVHYDMEIGSDFGRGGAVFLNGENIVSRTDDLWWYGNWDLESEIMKFSFDSEPGNQMLEVYGSEGCCDGINNMRISKNKGEWQDMSQIDFTQNNECGSSFSFLEVGQKKITKQVRKSLKKNKKRQTK